MKWLFTTVIGGLFLGSFVPLIGGMETNCGSVTARVGDDILLDAGCLLASSPDVRLYRWDFDGDGTWDTGWMANSTIRYLWTSPFSGSVYVEGAPVTNEAVRISAEEFPPPGYGSVPEDQPPIHAQSFIPHEPIITAVEVWLLKTGNPLPGLVYLHIREELEGGDIALASVPIEAVPTGIEAFANPDSWTRFNVPYLGVTPGRKYYLLLNATEIPPNKAEANYGVMRTQRDFYIEGGTYRYDHFLQVWQFGDYDDLEMRIHTAFPGSAVRGRFDVTVVPGFELAASLPAYVDEGSPFTSVADATLYGPGDITFRWDFGDGTVVDDTSQNPGIIPFHAISAMDHAYGDDGRYLVTITARTDGVDEAVVAGAVEAQNVAPILLTPHTEVHLVENAVAALSVRAMDAGSDDLTVSWSWTFGGTREETFYNDGVSPDPPVSPWGTFPFTAGSAMVEDYGDDGAFPVSVQVCDDDGGCAGSLIAGAGEILVATVFVSNVAPTVDDLQVYAPATLTLRVAGEKFHDVCLDVTDLGTPTATACVVRTPGSPDAQSRTLPGQRIRVLGDTALVLRYTPDDDPVNGQRNGATPAWVDLAFADGSVARLHHAFNVRHPDTWTWTLDDLKPLLAGKPLTFEVTASDPGSDDLTVDLDFGDGGTFTSMVFNDGVGPDPYPSPAVHPATATFTATHAYPGGIHLATVTVRDDDRGNAVVLITLKLG